ncbi:MAG: hypothetical protein ACFFBF_07045 [Promethearchaeota archaeon]
MNIKIFIHIMVYDSTSNPNCWKWLLFRVIILSAFINLAVIPMIQSAKSIFRVKIY